MSERKVLNKYYPPDFDPRKIPRLRLPKTRQYTVRIMTPFNMRCKTCGDYIAKAKKFNARKETVESESYLGLKIFRFYFKCPCCMAEITFKTDPKKCDYELEHGAIRNFDAYRKAQEMAEKQAKDEEEEEKINLMKKLEKRTKASRREMQELEELEEIKEMNKTEINHDELLEERKKMEEKLIEEARLKAEKEDDEILEEFRRYQRQMMAGEVEEVLDEEEELPEEEKIVKTSPEASGSDRSEIASLNSQKTIETPLKRKIASLVRLKDHEVDKKPKSSVLCAYSDSDDST